MPDSRKRSADAAFLIALMLYILVGTARVPVHADEFMQMAMARDYFYMIRGQWDQLTFKPPVEPDTEQYLRLLNGTINKDLIGLAWQLDGRSPETLPGIYAWAMPLEWNRAQGNVPSDDALHAARWASAILTALGVIPAFLLGWNLRLRSLAYPAALLYALHPVILLNGRRAMAEGALMFFTLWTMYWLVAMIVAEHSATATGFVKRVPSTLRYVILGVLIGLTVAAKQTGLVVAGTALLAALAAGLMRGRLRQVLARIALAGVIGLLTWFALNPAYWNDPGGALQAMLDARLTLLKAQSNGAVLVYTNPLDRVGAILTQPFLAPPQYYEAPTWAGLLNQSVDDYQNSAVNGWDWGPVVGLVLTVLSGIGLVALIYDARHRDLVAWAILIWAGATVLAALVIPFAWQRYYLPLTLVAIMLAAEGLGRLLVRRSEVAVVASEATG
jgi:4-amino-4-deoxy-L-arabinose transferase-like glycosyltransferase